MRKFGVLVVDDSAVMRKNISLVVESEHFTVIGKARNGLDALEKIACLKPDLIVMDVDMPELDGLQALQRQMEQQPLPIIIVSDNVEDAIEAKRMGAIDFFEKTDFISGPMYAVKTFLKRRTQQQVSPLLVEPLTAAIMEAVPERESTKNDHILIIGSSTGGPAALQAILTAFPAKLHVPVVIVQHMPEGFTKPLASRFNELCAFEVKEAEHQELLSCGTVYIAPAGLHTVFQQNKAGQYMIHLESSTPYKTLYKPSIDVALLSIAKQAKERIVTVILTGMGDDGLRGCQDVKAYGGTVFTEAEESCVVYGMPKVVAKAGLADKQLPLAKLAKEIEKYIV